MEEKGVRDRKREPEEYNFDYEELADAEVDSEHDVMMLYGKQPVIQRIRILWNRRTLRRMRTMGSTRKGMTWMTSTRGTGSASGSGHG